MNMAERRLGMSHNATETYDTFPSEPDNTSKTTANGITIQEAIEHIGFGWKQAKIGIVASLSQLTDGIEVMAVALLGQVLLCDWQLSATQEATITTAVFTGYLIGATALGYFADIYGRKKIMVLSAVCVFYFGFLSAWSPTYTWLLILRFLVGIGVSGSCFSTSYFVEFLPAKRRGKLIIFQWGFFCFGGTIATLLGLLIMRYSWRWWLVSMSFPALIFVILSRFLPTSPRYELACGNKEVAYEMLNDLAKSNGKEMPKGDLLLMEIKERGHFMDLFKPEYRLTSVLLAFLWFTTILIYYGTTLFTTELVKTGSCVSELNMSTQMACFEQCEGLKTADLLAILWTTFADVLGTVITALTIDSLGRKNTMVLQLILFSSCCILLCICMPRMALIVVLFCVRVPSIGASQIVYLYTAEIYPTEVRALAMGVGVSIGRIGAIVTPYLAQVLLPWSLYAGLSVYVFMGLFSIGLVCLLPVETKGRSID